MSLDRQRRLVVLSVATTSFVTLLSEIALTRIVSYVLFYPFTYLLIGIALLGLGLGAAWVALRVDWAWSPEKAANGFLGFAWGIAAGTLALSILPLNLKDLFSRPTDPIIWSALVVALTLPFCASGIILSSAFRLRSMAPGTLYAADLACAALASLAVVPLLATIGPVRALTLTGFIAMGAAVVLSERRGRMLGLGSVALLILMYLGINHLSGFRPAAGKHLRELWARKIIYSAWHPLFRIDVTAEWTLPEGIHRRDLWHDGNVGSAFIGVPDPEAGAKKWDKSIKHTPFLVTDKPSVLIIGAAGGGDIAVARHYGSRHVTGVELHPVTGYLIRGPYKEFTNNLVDQPDVDYIVSEGRRFVELSPDKYDLIQLVSPDSYAAQPGAAQVLVENYLYTREAFTDYWNALSDHGVLALEIGDLPGIAPQNALRLVAQARDLLEHLGVKDPEKHIVVVNESIWFFVVSEVMISKSPFTHEALQRLRDAGQNSKLQLLWDPENPDLKSPFGYLATGGSADRLDRFNLGYLDLSAVSDDSPFFFTYFRWKSLLSGTEHWGLAREYATGQYLVLVLLVVAAGGLLAALAVPLAFRQRNIGLLHAWSVGLALTLLGWGFLAVEVNTIQRLTLFLGYPTYAFTAVLAGILLGAGLGSAWSGRARAPVVLGVGTTTVILMALGTGFVLPGLVGVTFAQPLLVRAVIAFLWAAAQGFGLGVFFPSALKVLGNWGPRWVAWGWTVNGTASVLGSALAVLMAMIVGFRLGALMAASGYVVAAILLLRAQPSSEVAPVEEGFAPESEASLG